MFPSTWDTRGILTFSVWHCILKLLWGPCSPILLNSLLFCSHFLYLALSMPSSFWMYSALYWVLSLRIFSFLYKSKQKAKPNTLCPSRIQETRFTFCSFSFSKPYSSKPVICFAEQDAYASSRKHRLYFSVSSGKALYFQYQTYSTHNLPSLFFVRVRLFIWWLPSEGPVSVLFLLSSLHGTPYSFLVNSLFSMNPCSFAILAWWYIQAQ